METSNLIIHAYVQRGHHGYFNLFIQSGNALPVYNSQHDSFVDASNEATRMGASMCLLVHGVSPEEIQDEMTTTMNQGNYV